ncbi:hypothetical protein C8Q76DRAFT_746738 [Earliella scabrosa]|nr:hypothetical protein C8Q76DRAFT_746738 [Earliella scabrosa]
MNATVSWQAEPHFRGTYSILTSCLSTLFVSTWSALHLDIPESGKRGQSAFGRFVDKLGWLVLGLLAPEYLLLLAFNQFMAARELTEFAQWRLETPTEDPSLLGRFRGWIVTGARELTKFAQKTPGRFRGWIVTGLHHLLDIFKRKSAHAVRDTEKGETQGSAAAVHEMEEAHNTAAEADSATNAGPTIRAENAESSGNLGSEPAGGSNREPGVESSTPPPRTRRKRKHPWTITHSFFAIMGGFVLQDPHDTLEDRYLPAWQGNGVLAEDAIRVLMDVEPDLIPDIPVDELLDRGKADGLAKMLLAWQVLWFCLSCLNRAVQHLPLSLLEVTTIAHALCALLTYAVWWKKPKDVGQPIVIGMHSDEDRECARRVGAWLSTMSSTNRSLLFNGIQLYYIPEGLYDLPRRFKSANAWPTWLKTSMQQLRDPFRGGLSQFLSQFNSANPLQHWLTTLKLNYIFYGRPLPWYVDGSSIDKAEEQAVNERMHLLSSLSEDKFRNIIDSPYWLGHPLVVPVAHIQSATHTAKTAKSRSSIGLALLPAVYGFPHLIGLGAMFPTDVERSLWRWTTVAIMVLGVGTFCIVYMIATVGEWWYWRTAGGSVNERFAEVVRDRVSKAVAVLNVLVYFLGSMFLVVESFRQLFALPPDSFTLPSWGNYWPHFG